jgi:hypothetical protein
MKFLVMPDGKARQVCSKVDSSYLIPGQHCLVVSTYLRFCTQDFFKVDIIFFLQGWHHLLFGSEFGTGNLAMNQNDFFISPICTQKDWDDCLGFSAIDAFLPKVLFSILTTEACYADSWGFAYCRLGCRL